MDTPRSEIEELKQRVARAERNAKTFCCVGITALIASITVLAAGPVESQINAATKKKGTKVKAPFSVVDSKGRTLFRVMADSDGGTHVDVMHGGTELVELGHIEGLQGIRVNDLEGQRVTDIGVDQEDQGRGIDVHDENGVKVVDIGIGDEGRGIDVHDSAGVKAVDIGIGDEGRGVDVHDQAGVKVIDLGIGDQGRGLDIHNTAGNPVARVNSGTNGGEARLFNNAGAPTFTAP